MTDRIQGFIVTLKKDMRADDAQPIMDAIGLIHNIANVSPHVSDIEAHLARQQVRRELIDKLFEVLK